MEVPNGSCSDFNNKKGVNGVKKCLSFTNGFISRSLLVISVPPQLQYYSLLQEIQPGLIYKYWANLHLGSNP